MARTAYATVVVSKVVDPAELEPMLRSALDELGARPKAGAKPRPWAKGDPALPDDAIRYLMRNPDQRIVVLEGEEPSGE